VLYLQCESLQSRINFQFPPDRAVKPTASDEWTFENQRSIAYSLALIGHLKQPRSPACSGTGTNLKVGGTTPTRKWGHSPAYFLVVSLHFFGSKTTISRFGDRFRDGQYSLVSFFVCISSTHGAPVPSHLLKWGHVPPMQSPPLLPCTPQMCHTCHQVVVCAIVIDLRLRVSKAQLRTNT